MALWRLGQPDEALALMDGLIQAEPQNPYFYQAKGQILFENGRIADSIAPLQRAASLAPKNTDEIHTEYAQALLERDDPKMLPTAIDELKLADKAEPLNPETHRFLAVAYGRQGQEAVANVELAEQALLEGHGRAAQRFAMDAMRRLPAGSRDWLHAQDIVAEAQTRKSHDEDHGSGFQMSVGPANGTMSGAMPGTLSTHGGFAQHP